ncbi:MAG: protein translocase subunit SecF [Vicinamibacterales bacterium]
MQILSKTNYNFVRWRYHALVFSWIIILAGALFIWKQGMPLGVEFSGGTIVIEHFDQPIDLQRVREAVNNGLPNGTGQGAMIQSYGDSASNQVLIRVPTVGAETGAQLSATAEAVNTALQQANIGQFNEVGREIVGPIVGQQLTRQGVLATALALGGILLYVAFRFQFSFAVGAVVATVHDLLVTMAFLAFFRYDLSLNVIAALLTITGYSVNDTIVIFDRVRENLRGMRRDSLETVVNVAVNQTLSRTILTAGTTLFSVLSLYLFGGEVLHGFAFTMLVGVITGTYSSVFIAAAIVIIWQGRRPLKGQPAAPASAPAKPNRRRAS